MSLANLLTGWTVPDLGEESRIHSFSTTADILSYRRSPRQYGYFKVRGFPSVNATQQYFGTLMHDVLDRINRDYHQKPGTSLPTDDEIGLLVQQAHDRLVRSGIHAFSPAQQQAQIRKLIHRFVTLIGPKFFPYVQETEYHLKRSLQTPRGLDYVLDGVVDVLSGAVSHALKLPFPTSNNDIEIWDYKSGQMPDKDDPRLKDYEYQMWVYAELFRQQTGTYPARSVLVFVGELGNDQIWELFKDKPHSYPGLMYVVHKDSYRTQEAMASFHQTVEDIEAELAKPYDQQWLAPPAGTVDEKTCEACDLRFNCDSYPQGRNLQSQPL